MILVSHQLRQIIDSRQQCLYFYLICGCPILYNIFWKTVYITLQRVVSYNLQRSVKNDFFLLLFLSNYGPFLCHFDHAVQRYALTSLCAAKCASAVFDCARLTKYCQPECMSMHSLNLTFSLAKTHLLRCLTARKTCLLPMTLVANFC